MLELRGVEANYGPSQVLHGVDLTIPAGGAVGLLGRNGMGKTTLAHTITGIVPDRRGSIRLAGQEISRWSPERRSRSGVSLVPQGHRVFGSLTVAENLRVGARPPRSGTDGWTVADIFDRFPILRQRSSVRAGLLSGGQQQMLALSRSLMQNPSVLIMDEPTEGLDPATVAQIGAVVEQARSSGTTVLLIEQKVAFTLEHVSRVLILSRGQIVFESADLDRLRSDASVLRQYLGAGPATDEAARG